MRLSAHYELQSMADIGRAQAIAKVDQSGHALGTAMYLAQQSVEKQLKSIMVRLDEALGLGSIDKILRGLSHEFYPRLYEIYRLRVECAERALRERYGIRPDPEIFKYTESVATDFREASSYWANYRNNPAILRLTWLQSLGVSLPKEDLHRLNRWHAPQIAFTPGATPAHEDEPKFADFFPPADLLPIEILDDSALARHIVEYAQTPANTHSRMVLSGTLEATHPDRLRIFGEKHADVQAMLARMGLAEFGLHVMASMTQQYVLLYPHNSTGRYPEPAGNGLFTPDIYKRQARHVLGSLFVVVPYHLGELRANSGIIGEISERGRRLGYWAGSRAPGRVAPGARRGRSRKRRRVPTGKSHPARPVDMGALALRYARQADSDMRHAHAAARADSSGYALADAMLLGQQSIEKHLKAATLLAAGMLGAGGALGLPGVRGHDAYRWILALFARYAGSARAPGPDAAQDPEAALAIGRSADFWDSYSSDTGLQELAWRYSIGAPLGKGGRARLDRGLMPCAREAGILAGDPGTCIPQLSREAAAGGSMRDDVMRPEALCARRRAHMGSRWNYGMRAAVRRRFDACRAMPLRGTTGTGGSRAGARDALSGRLAAEFCLTSLAMLGPGYLHVYPHNPLGRYPGVVGGCVTTDLYRSHADGVRHLLFVDIPCQARQISRVAAFARMLQRERGALRGKPAS